LVCRIASATGTTFMSTPEKRSHITHTLCAAALTVYMV
jgi:hypothetical protein